MWGCWGIGAGGGWWVVGLNGRSRSWWSPPFEAWTTTKLRTFGRGVEEHAPGLKRWATICGEATSPMPNDA